MTDVWIRTYEQEKDDIRRGMALATLARWAKEPVEIKLIEASQFSITEGRQLAEDEAESDPYIFTDNDVCILGQDWVERAVTLLMANPEYAIISTLSMIESENVARPGFLSHDPLEEWMDVYPMHAVGAPMIIRKGIIPTYPEMTLGSECGDIYQLVLKAGKKQGLIHPKHRIRHNHMGHGFSSTPGLNWGYTK